jgi:hypothetical protein
MEGSIMTAFRDPEEQGARTLQQALGYARHGWPVFPCIPGEKIPATKHGFEDATTDPEQITRWWSASPGRNLAVATGAPGPDVIDVDDHGERGNGFAAFNKIRHAGLADHPLAVVRTPSGGFHLYFRADPQRPQGNGSLPEHHIDFRGTGGYVLAPPSSVGGRRYEVVSHQPEAATVDFSAIRGLLDPPEAHPRPARLADTQTDVERLAAHVERLQPGNRNGGLYWAASRAAEAGVLDDAAAERLIGAALTAGIRGGEREARRTVQSAQRGRGLDPTQRPQREREAG